MWWSQVSSLPVISNLSFCQWCPKDAKAAYRGAAGGHRAAVDSGLASPQLASGEMRFRLLGCAPHGHRPHVHGTGSMFQTRSQCRRHLPFLLDECSPCESPLAACLSSLQRKSRFETCKSWHPTLSSPLSSHQLSTEARLIRRHSEVFSGGTVD